MFFMRFCDRRGVPDPRSRGVRVVEGLKPWRLARAGGAKRILELGTGEAARLRIAVGDRLVLDEAA